MSFIKTASKTYLKFLGLVLAPIAVLFVIFFIVNRSHEELVKKNRARVLNLEKGMTGKQVIEIMGTKLLTKTTWERDSVYSYETELFSSSPIYILFDEKVEVKQVIVPEGVRTPVGGDKSDVISIEVDHISLLSSSPHTMTAKDFLKWSGESHFRKRVIESSDSVSLIMQMLDKLKPDSVCVKVDTRGVLLINYETHTDTVACDGLCLNYLGKGFRASRELGKVIWGPKNK